MLVKWIKAHQIINCYLLEGYLSSITWKKKLNRPEEFITPNKNPFIISIGKSNLNISEVT